MDANVPNRNAARLVDGGPDASGGAVVPDEQAIRAARAVMKQDRARAAAQAMHQYEAEELAVVAKTARLRALRLAREAADPPPPQNPLARFQEVRLPAAAEAPSKARAKERR